MSTIGNMNQLPEQAIDRVASYFQALAEPTRLRILNLLREAEHNVGELAEACGYTAANMSRHLAVLMQQGFVKREGRGTSVYYQIADPTIYALCDLVCDRITQQHLAQAWPVTTATKKRPTAARRVA
jgi:DNA-binding transcriptional ArsR family regulator